MKYTDQQTIDRYKTRLVARGFTQIYGIDYSDIYTLTLGADTLRLLLAIIAIKDIEAYQVDVNNAFIESIFHNIIYIYSFEGLKVSNRYVFLVVKSLYGLK